MNTIEIKKGTLINSGSFHVSIATFNETDVAIISKHTGDFVKFKDIIKGEKLAKIKRKFKTWINNDETFNFQFMQPETTRELIKMLRK